VHGPHVRNFAEIYAALEQARGARAVADAGMLAAAIDELFRDPDERQRMRLAADEVVAGFGGTLARTLGAIEPYLMQLKLGPA
jgi:3-deoxy-D-manno-octulosonic-acid transferase